MNKAELSAALAEKTGLSKMDAEKMVEAFVEIVTTTLKGGGEVTIAGFGSFLSKERAPRMGVNPQNPSIKVQIPGMRVPKFKAGVNLKKALK
ncbi:HU family DNA-binding protein [Patescibacteria group bacterium]|nr:MAG: HU family DNA-binding protein [Patescibacteria group bacterium]